MKKISKIAALIIMLSLVGVACGGNGENDNNTPCNCPETAHLDFEETCDCGLANCNCTQKVWGNVVDAERDVNIPIYKKGDVSDEDMEAAVRRAENAYDSWDHEGNKNVLVGKIAAIVIMPNAGSTYVPGGADRRTTEDGKQFIIEFGKDRTQTGMQTSFNQAANALNELDL